MFIIRLILFAVGIIILVAMFDRWVECSNWLCTEWTIMTHLVHLFVVGLGYSFVSLSMTKI